VINHISDQKAPEVSRQECMRLAKIFLANMPVGKTVGSRELCQQIGVDPRLYSRSIGIILSGYVKKNYFAKVIPIGQDGQQYCKTSSFKLKEETKNSLDSLPKLSRRQLVDDLRMELLVVSHLLRNVADRLDGLK